MKQSYWLAGCLALAPILLADVRYTETAQITGGAMSGMMGMASRMSGRKMNTDSEHVLKGNKMAEIREEATTITDLDAETVTTINHKAKTYSVMTFAEQKAAMEKAASRMGAETAKKPEVDASANVKVSSKSTGKTMDIVGVRAKEFIMTMTTEITDNKSKSSMATNMSMDLWNGTPKGYQELKAFRIKMAQKLASGMAMNPAMMQMGMNNLHVKAEGEMQKLDGLAMLTVMRMGATPESVAVTGTPSASAEAPKEEKKKGGGLFGKALGQMAAGAAGVHTRDEDAAGQRGNSNEPFMVMETRITAYSSSPVDDAVFVVPAGYKLVDSPMKKMLDRK